MSRADKLRHSATSGLLMRDDVIVVSSVSCIYGLGPPDEYKKHMIPLKVNQEYDLEETDTTPDQKLRSETSMDPLRLSYLLFHT